MQASQKTIVLGVSGGIAVYKACELVRVLKEQGYGVRVVMTKGAQEFVTPMTFQALSLNPVHTSLFDLTQESEMGHIHLADTADLICIAPATADLIAKIAHGLCDDLLTTIVSASRAPKLICPAMNVHMWDNPITQKNVQAVQSYGMDVMDPDCGSLACGYDGKGRLPDPKAIADRIAVTLSKTAKKKALAAKKVLVTAGPTREFIDPFRFVSNPSSGKMGIAFAEAARDSGAEVELLLGPCQLPLPRGMTVHRFQSAKELLDLTVHHAKRADIVIMAAAVSDYTIPSPAEQKIKKNGRPFSVTLTPTVDILKTLSAWKKRPFLIGFAAETDHLESHAKNKLDEKGCDLILGNQIGNGQGFEAEENTLVIFSKTKPPVTLGPLPKPVLARQVLDHLIF